MAQPTNYKYHSTGQFHNAVKTIRDRVQFKGGDEDGNAIIDSTAMVPTLKYVGTTKLHGTNGSIVLHKNGDISFHSKSQLLAYIPFDTGAFTLLRDNAEFAQCMSRREAGVRSIIAQVVDRVSDKGKLQYPIKIAGEWCGPSIQKGVGVAFLKQKSFFIFGVKLGETDQQNKTGWAPVDDIKGIEASDHHIYNITSFPMKRVTIDFNKPEYIQNELVAATDEVEECCPVAKALGVEQSLLGEGLVWTPTSEEYCWDTGTWFKTKGTKHSVSKTKSVAAVDPEKLESIDKFIDYAVTGNRLEQGLSEIGLDQKTIGQYIGWVNRDINKEEGDVLGANNLTMKDIGKYVSNKAREFYLGKLNQM